MIMLDATKSATQRELLEAELEAVGIRLNTQRPNVYFKVCCDFSMSRFFMTSEIGSDRLLSILCFSFWTVLDQNWRRNQHQCHLQTHLIDRKDGPPYSSRLQYVCLAYLIISKEGCPLQVHVLTNLSCLSTLIGIFNAEVLIREDITVDQFIDVVLGNRKYIQCIYVRERGFLREQKRRRQNVLHLCSN